MFSCTFHGIKTELQQLDCHSPELSNQPVFAREDVGADADCGGQIERVDPVGQRNFNTVAKLMESRVESRGLVSEH